MNLDGPTLADALLQSARSVNPDEPMRQAIQWLYAVGKAAGVDHDPPILTARYRLPLFESSKHETESAKIGWVYYAAHPDGMIKIGAAAGGEGKTTLHTRLLNLEKELDCELRLLAFERGYKKLEEQRHYFFRDLNLGREWFHAGPALLAHIEDLIALIQADTSWHKSKWAHRLAHYPWFTQDMLPASRLPRELSQTPAAVRARRSRAEWRAGLDGRRRA